MKESNIEKYNAEELNKTYKDTVNRLNDEIKKLTNELNVQVKDCVVGAWCKDCKYYNSAYLANQDNIDAYVGKTRNLFSGSYYNTYYYCSKHLREICPKFEK